MSFVEVARFSSRLEAESIGHALDQYEIPFMVQSADIGIFGPGHTGVTPGGASLLVPAERVKEVSELLSCVVKFEELEENDAKAAAGEVETQEEPS